MAQLHVLMGADTIRARPVIRTIGLADLKDALTRGLADFSAIPTHAVFLCLIYPIVGLVLARAILGYALLPLLFPLAAGFALVGPFAAIGFYELSRRREQGLDISWEDTLDVLHSPSRDAIAALGFLLLVIFAIWIAIAQAIYVANFGYQPAASIPHQSDHHGGVGVYRRRAVAGGLVAVFLRPRGSGAGTRSFDMASLSQGCGTGSQSAPGASASGAKASICGPVPGRAVRRRGKGAAHPPLSTARKTFPPALTRQDCSRTIRKPASPAAAARRPAPTRSRSPAASLSPRTSPPRRG